MLNKIENIIKSYGVEIVDDVYAIDDVKLERSFQYSRYTIDGFEFTLDDFKNEMDKMFPREHAKYCSIKYRKVPTQFGNADNHIIRLIFNDGRDEITKRNDSYYERSKIDIRYLLFDEYGKEQFVYKKALLKLVKELYRK